MAITDQLVAYWDLSEASGTRADALSTSPLTDNNSVTGTTGPGSHNASLFTRINNESLSHIDSTTLSVGNQDFTFCAWVNFTTILADMTICGHINGSINDRSWKLSTDGTYLECLVSSDGTATQYWAFNTVPLSTGTWYFGMFYHDAANDVLAISLNNATPRTLPGYTAGVHDSGASFAFGAQNEMSLNYLNGAIAMAGLWKRVLTTDEITFLYNSGNGRAYSELAPSTTPLTATLTDKYALYR